MTDQDLFLPDWENDEANITADAVDTTTLQGEHGWWSPLNNTSTNDYYHSYHRDLADAAETDPPPENWEPILTVIVLVIMFSVLVTDKIGTDSVMLTAMTVFYISGIIDVKEAIAGFSSQGLLTVLVLFVVAEGLNKTGALNWYVGKMFGQPKTPVGAQLRVVLPIAALSGVINDTPLVTVVLPIVIQWARKVRLNPRLIMMPLSFAALLGGVITIIGTSTNLIVVGLLIERYPDSEFFQNMPLFGIALYGVPVAFTGVAYMLLASPLLLDRHKVKDGASAIWKAAGTDDILLGARVLPWSPAADRSIQRSGLRDNGGIYLVRVKRQATGNIHTAVGPQFVLNVGDILYFTGMIETFAQFCEEHGLQMVTNEIEDQLLPQLPTSGDESDMVEEVQPLTVTPTQADLGTTLESWLDVPDQERMRVIFSMEDAIRGVAICQYSSLIDQDRIIVATHDALVVIAIDTEDRSGLLLDISKCYARLNMDIKHSEAAVKEGRSLSIWRCESSDHSQGFVIEVWRVLHALLANQKGVHKQRGLQVVRAQVQDGRLAGKSVADIDFRGMYKAAIVAIQSSSTASAGTSLSSRKLQVGDILILQVGDDSHLLRLPPTDFYDNLADASSSNPSRKSSFSGIFLRKKARGASGDGSDVAEMEDGSPTDGDEVVDRMENAEDTDQLEAIWKDLRVIVQDSSGGEMQREFLTAMRVNGTSLVGKTCEDAGIAHLPGTYLVSLERPVHIAGSGHNVTSFETMELFEPLREGDVIWFSGTAASVGDLRKIPGLALYDSEEVTKMEEPVHYRRLVEAVIARRGPLVGKTAKEVRFRTQYGAAVIAVHREGKRIQEFPGNIKLQAGDVLLLEAGQSFMANKIKHDESFALIAEVKDSAPPRFRMLIPAVLLTVGAYGCYVAKLSTLFGTGMVAAILMVALGVLSEAEFRAAIRWEIYLTIAPAFGVSQALINSGVAGTVAGFIVKIGSAIGLGDAGLLGAVYLSTVLISQLVANNAAAALIFPIAMDAAERTGTDLTLMAYNIMFAASAAFMTPFGYQTNLMVMGPGGYSTTDFLVFGTPMQVVMLVATTAFLVVKEWWISWIVAFGVVVGVSFIRLGQDMRKLNHNKKD